MNTLFKPEFTASFRYWELAVAASRAQSETERREIWSHWTGPDPLMHPRAMCGYWKMRVGRLEERKWTPVAIYLDSGGEEVVAMVGSSIRRSTEGPASEGMLQIWSRCGRDPISYEAYEYAVRYGRFPGEIEDAALRLDNYADDPGAKFRDDMVELAGRVELYLKQLGSPLSDDAANTLANYMDMLRAATATAEELLTKEIEEQKAEIVRRKQLWEAPVTAVTDLVGKIRGMITPYLSAKKAAGDPTPRIGGQAGKRIGLGKVWKARVTDWDKVMVEYHNDRKVRELILTLLNARAKSKERADLVIDGAEFYEEETAR
jgi:hypothetical protein